MYLLDNTLRPYAWGSEHAIAELLGREPSGGPEAELWVGAHPGAPSQVLLADGTRCGLDELIASDPEALLGTTVAERFERRLPFLLKVLAAGSALSLQVHPSLEQASAGYDAEEAAGVPADAPHRNYKDRNHKPEMIFALTPFEALCGFRPLADARAAFAFLAGLVDAGSPAREFFGAVADALAGDTRSDVDGSDATDAGGGAAPGPARERPATDTATTAPATGGHAAASPDAAILQSVFRRLLETPDTVVTAAAEAAGRTPAPAGATETGALATVAELSEQYPGDPGVLVSLLLNRVSLQPGEVLHLPAGNVHAYLGGLGIEVMASSDNVLRGGLTPKHVDTAELLDTVVFEPLAPPTLEPQFTLLDQELYRPPFEEFLLQRIVLTAPVTGYDAGLGTGHGDPADGDLGSGGRGGDVRVSEGSPTPAQCPVLQNGPVVVLAVSGAILLDTPNSTLAVPRGGSAFVAASEAPLLVRPAADQDGSTDGPVLAFAVTVGGDLPAL